MTCRQDQRADLELAAAEETYQKARRTADDIAAQRQQWRDRAAACKAICEQYPQWSQIDTETADGHADRLREQYELLLADHPDIEALNARADECWSQIQKLMTRRGAIQTRRDGLDERRTRLLELQERLSPAFVSEPLTDLLRRYAARCRSSLELLDPEPHRDALFTAIKKEREQLRESRRRSYDELARILNTFDTSFPDAIPNDSDDFDERVHDYVALCRHIDERELPEAYERMMRLVTEQAPDAILTLHRVAEQETRRISEQIDRVNTGLGAVEFNRGTRLTLRATPRQLPAVAELTEIVRSISRRIAEVGLGDKQAILDQYADILRLRNRLASTRAGGQGVDARRAGRAQPVHVRLRRVGRRQRRADPHAQQCRRQLRRRAGEADGVLPRGRAELQPGQPRKCRQHTGFRAADARRGVLQVRPAVRAAGAAGVP